MDLLKDPSFKYKYQKSKLCVKIWESDFKKIHGRNPSQNDIREASQKVREAYKNYYKLKTLALQGMDISFADETENSSTEMGLKETTELNKLGADNNDSMQHRSALAEIKNDVKRVDFTHLGNKESADHSSLKSTSEAGILPSDNSETDKTSSQESSNKLGNAEGVWGAHLNKEKTIEKETKKLVRRTSSFHFSEKLFVGSKFSKKNPRKSRSFSKPNKRNLSDGFPVSSSFENSQDSSQFLSQDESFFRPNEYKDAEGFSLPAALDDSQDSSLSSFSLPYESQTEINENKFEKSLVTPAISIGKSQVKSDGSLPLNSFKNCLQLDQSNECGYVNKLEKPQVDKNSVAKDLLKAADILSNTAENMSMKNVLLEDKYKIISLSTPITSQAVSAIHKALLTSHLKEKKFMPNRALDKGWLDRCTKSNSLEHKPAQVNDSGIESMESSTILDSCSSREDTPKLKLPNKRSSAPVYFRNETNVHGTSDSDDEVIGNSEDEQEQDQSSFGMRRLSYGSKRKLKLIDRSSQETSLMMKPAKKAKNDEDPICQPGRNDTVVEIPSTVEIDKIAEAIVSSEKEISVKKNGNSGKMTQKERLEKKIASGQLNENFVRINIKKKVYVRGKKSMTYSKYKKAEWKKKKKMNGNMFDSAGGSDGLLKCFKCGDVGHFARQCLSMKGDKLLPEEEEDDDVDDSPFPTLEEVEAMALEPMHASKRKVLSSQLLTPTGGNSQNNGTFDPLDFMNANAVEPLYPLKENGDLIDTPPEVYEALEKFGHDGFRPGQEEAIMRILSGLSTLVTLATGGGKSLCYQLPAYLYSQRSKCITLVVSPLVSLMEDQVTGVSSCVQAACLHTNQTQQQRQKVIDAAKSGALDILLVSPEAVVSGERATGFGSILRELPNIAFACIDEAHCVSQWSHNFRPSYLVICKVLREKLGVKTVLGLTATATKATCSSIVTHLNIPDGEKGVIKDIPLPCNLVLSVSRDAQRDRALISLLQGKRFKTCQSIIIYCIRRDECERLASLIRTCLQDSARPEETKRGRRISWNSEPYHAGLSAARRKQVQKAFMNGNLRIVVATVAFGMGINKQDIRAVIHYNMPRNFESYVQEVGRAGRDGLPAHCHLFLDSEGGDLNELRRHIYANSVDRHNVRKLLQRVFVPCKCVKFANLLHDVDFSDDVTAKDFSEGLQTPSVIEESPKKEVKNKINCPGHEVAFSVPSTVKALDLPEENISTMLCYLELHKKRWIKVMSPAYTMCKIMSYKGPKALKAAAKSCPPLSMAIALDQRRGVSHDNSNVIEFPVVDVAAAIGWDSGIVKRQLKNLEWKKVDDRWKRTGITAEFFDLGFRVLAPGNLSPTELDEALDTLHSHIEAQEQSSLQQLKTVFESLTSVSYPQHTECIEDADTDRSENLKVMIRKYFEEDHVSLQPEPKEEVLENEDQIASDVRSLVCMYRDNNFTARAVARIFHGIASPCYPAQVWGRCRFWRAHLNSNFKLICKIATREILRLK